MTNLYQIC